MKKLILSLFITGALIGSGAYLGGYFKSIEVVKAKVVGQCSIMLVLRAKFPFPNAERACQCVVDSAEKYCLDDARCYLGAMSLFQNCYEEEVRKLQEQQGGAK